MTWHETPFVQQLTATLVRASRQRREVVERSERYIRMLMLACIFLVPLYHWWVVLYLGMLAWMSYLDRQQDERHVEELLDMLAEAKRLGREG